MKKYLIALLALAMMFALAVPVFAAEESSSETFESLPGDTSQAVKAAYEKGTDNKDDVAKVYYVTVDWTVNSTLKYSDGTTTYTWNAEDTKYDKETDGEGWEGSATVTIKVTNKSNDDITAKATWANEGTIVAPCSFTDNGEIEVESAAKDVDLDSDNLQGAAQTKTITATVDQPTAGTINANDATVGTITVHIAAKVQP